MKNRRKNREAFAEHSYWQSYSDMMAALLLIFILIIAITLAVYKQKTTDLDQTRLELDTAQSQLESVITTPKRRLSAPTRNWLPPLRSCNRHMKRQL